MSDDQLQALCATATARAELALLNEVSAQVRCGLGTLQGPDRGADPARRRAVAAWILSEQHGWTVERIAAALHRSLRHTKRMLADQPKMAEKQGRKRQLRHPLG